MKLKKKLIPFLTILFLIISNAFVFANEDVKTEEPPEFVQNEALNEKDYKGSTPPEEFTQSKNEDEGVKARATTYFKVGYVYASKANSSDKYASKVTFKELKSYSDFNDALNKMNEYYNLYINSDTTKAYGMCIMNNSNKIIAMKTGRAYISTSSATLTMDENYAGSKPYVSNNHEVYYYSSSYLSSTQSKCKIGISGITNYTSSANLTLVPRSIISGVYKSASSSTKKYSYGYYSVNSIGDLVHTISTLTNPNRTSYFESGEQTSLSSFVVDKAPSFMKKGTNYYSMDGVNFYTDAYLTSSSKVGTYYPYYTYLPYRTKTSYTASELNNRISNYSSSSKLRNQGSALINAQNKYGINALLELSFANLESAYGTSWYAINRNNLFGIAAYDSNPDNAYSFSSVAKCIEENAYRHLSRGYFDADSDFRYYGTSPGNKKIGVNVKYASDPYHGEKIGGIAYQQDKLMASNDYEKYTIGVSTSTCYVYQNPSTSSKAFYKLATKSLSEPTGIPLVIIGSSGDFYKVQTEMGVIGNICTYSYEYDYTKSVGYIPKKYVKIVRQGKTSSETESSTSSVKLSLTTPSFSPSLSYGFTPGYKNEFKVTTKATSNVKGATLTFNVYDKNNKLVARQTKTINSTSQTSVTFTWDGKATKENTAGYKTGSYVSTSSSGTTYNIKLTLTANGKSVSSNSYQTKLYSKATKLLTDVSKTTLKYKSKATLSMTPNRPGTSLIRIYNSKNELVYSYTFTNKKANTYLYTTFTGVGNYGKYNGKTLSKGTYTVKFTHGDYTYTYPTKLSVDMKTIKLKTDISKTSIVRKNSTVLSMYPNVTGNSYIKIYNSKNQLVASYKFTTKKENTRCAVTFKGYGNYGSFKNKLLAKGTYTVKFIHYDYTYTYPKQLTLK